MLVTWIEFKSVVDNKKLSIQWVDLFKRYYLNIFDGSFSLQCDLLQTDPKNEEQLDFETNYKANGNKSVKAEVVTQFEKDDKILKLACASAEVDEDGYAEIELKIPGSYGDGDGRFVDSGRVWFDSAHTGDRVVSLIVMDKDGVFGYGPNVIARVWHDEQLDEENQGWYIPKSVSGLTVESIGGYGFIPGGLYLQVKAKKGENQTTGTLFLNIKWGKEE